MRILFIARATIFSAPGGDTIQIQSTAKYLRRHALTVDVALANERINYAQYDLLHFFNITRPADILWHVQQSKKPFVISPIFIDYREYEREHQRGIISLLNRFLSKEVIEYLKVIARYFKNGEKINSWSFLWKGQRRSIIYLLQKAACLLPNSNSEYNRLYNSYHLHQRYFIIPNAIDPEKFVTTTTLPKDEHLVLCVARIEGIKNQYNLIQALNDTKFRLLIIGKPAPNHVKYYQTCVNAASSNIQFIDHLPQEQLIPMYQQASIHILPSWFETTGLSSLEAAVMGCKIVITDKGDTREYFKDFAYYCDPGDPLSIRDAIEHAALTPVNPQLRTHILKNYTWENTAEMTALAYKQILIP
jgi:glycosyltransferase involved in cell wall biosynthesis